MYFYEIMARNYIMQYLFKAKRKKRCSLGLNLAVLAGLVTKIAPTMHDAF